MAGRSAAFAGGDDGQDNDEANVIYGGPNGTLSLTRARINFITEGIFCPSRTDLREKQEALGSHDVHRHFVFDASTQTIGEPALNWQATIFELDDDPTNSRFKIGDHVLYYHRDLDSTNRIGQIETVEWNTNIKGWRYRLLDDAAKRIGQWFDGSRLQPNNVG